MRYLLLLLGLIAPVLAQEGFVPIPEWKVQAGDDLAWARADWDDSGWKSFAWPKFGNIIRLTEPGVTWYRSSVSIPSPWRGEELSVGIAPLDEVFEVYANGELVGSHGVWGKLHRAPFPAHESFAIPARLIQNGRITLAIRRWQGSSMVFYQVLAGVSILRPWHPPQLGLGVPMRYLEREHSFLIQMESLPGNFLRLCVIFVGCLSLSIWSANRARKENLWLGLFLIFTSVSSAVGQFSQIANVELRSLWSALAVFLYFFGLALECCFLISLLAKPPKLLQAMAAFLFLFAFSRPIAILADLNLLDVLVSGNGIPTIRLIATVVTIFGILATSRNGSHLLMALAISIAPLGQFWIAQIGPWLGRSSYIEAGIVLIDVRVVGLFLCSIMASTSLYLKNRGDSRRQSRLEQEISAARLIQDSLLQAESTADWKVDAVYLPAAEVGGDFYFTAVGEDGSLLVVTGDVSGKGLPAALLVAAVIGALGDLASRRPGEVLEHLNRSLLGKTRGGFVTCVCALFEPGGQVLVANAGHVAPWVDGREVELEPGLPLGIVAGVAYEVREVAGESFVFVSDGVVEAEDAQRELFGFERTREASGKSAQEIANAAKGWGQNDDITVVTVRRSQ